MGCPNFFKYHPKATLDQYCERFHYKKEELAQKVRKTPIYEKFLGSNTPDETKIMSALLELDTAKLTDKIYFGDKANKPATQTASINYIPEHEQKIEHTHINAVSSQLDKQARLAYNDPNHQQPIYLISNEEIDSIIEAMEQEISIYDNEETEYEIAYDAMPELEGMDDEKRRLLLMKLLRRNRKDKGNYMSNTQSNILLNKALLNQNASMLNLSKLGKKSLIHENVLTPDMIKHKKT